MSGSSVAGKNGTFEPPEEPQAQDQPGTEKAMKPGSEPTKLEGNSTFYEYTGVGKLRGMKAFITGGDSGIGRSVAILFAREGADVSIVYLPDEEEDAQGTKNMIEQEQKSCLLLPGNLMSNDNCKDAVEQHVQKYGRIDILVNNCAKQIMCSDFASINLDDVESTFRSNVLAHFAITKYALPHMKQGGSIINTSSVVAFRGTGAMVDYASSKAAVVGFTRALAKSLLPKGIRVNGVAPGPVHTPIQPASRPAEQMEGFGEKSQLGRPGQPSEIAPSFVFLASKESELYYGQILHPYPLGD